MVVPGKKRRRVEIQQQVAQSLCLFGTAVLLATPAQASEYPADTLLSSPANSRLHAFPHEPELSSAELGNSEIEKLAPTNKTISQFAQTAFERRRLAASQATNRSTTLSVSTAQPDRFERLRARLRTQPNHPALLEQPVASGSTPAVHSSVHASGPPASGTYLYGQQPEADRPGVAYFVFESQDSNVVGALFMPFSSFDCVQGSIVNQQIALNVKDSYSGSVHAHSLRLHEPLADVASQVGRIDSPPNIEGFYALPVRPQDRALLATCQST